MFRDLYDLFGIFPAFGFEIGTPEIVPIVKDSKNRHVGHQKGALRPDCKRRNLWGRICTGEETIRKVPMFVQSHTFLERNWVASFAGILKQRLHVRR